MIDKIRAPRNRTITLSEGDIESLRLQIKKVENLDHNKNRLIDNIVNSDFESCIPYIEDESIDLLVLDPPYNLDKNFNGFKFNKRSVNEYDKYLEEIFAAFKPKLKINASIYVCGDWKTSVSIYNAAIKYFKVRNRITWEREKGRGALSNWKNCSEDIWFCTVSDDYVFNVDNVKLRRKVIAPYRNADGAPKDWNETVVGNFRDTSPSNLWSDITIPFWSMPENTDHPTQKSEKLIAKLILASTHENGCVCDPFLGSGTTAVVAKKLNRHFIGVELNEEYALLAQKRLNMSKVDASIQGYVDGVFWERNSLNVQKDNDKNDAKTRGRPKKSNSEYNSKNLFE